MQRRPLQDVNINTQPIDRRVLRSHNQDNRDGIPAPTLGNVNKKETKAEKKVQGEGNKENSKAPIKDDKNKNSCMKCKNAVGETFFKCGVTCSECAATNGTSCPLCMGPPGTCREVLRSEVATILIKHFSRREPDELAVDIPKRKSRSIHDIKTIQVGDHVLPCPTIEKFNQFNDSLKAGNHVDEIKEIINTELEKIVEKTSRAAVNIFNNFVMSSVRNHLILSDATKAKSWNRVIFIDTPIHKIVTEIIADKFPDDNTPKAVELWFYSLNSKNATKAKKKEKKSLI